SQRAYCTGSGRSSPSSCFRLAYASGVEFSPNIAATGSPGISCSNRNTPAETTSMTGIVASSFCAMYFAIATRSPFVGGGLDPPSDRLGVGAPRVNAERDRAQRSTLGGPSGRNIGQTAHSGEVPWPAENARARAGNVLGKAPRHLHRERQRA